MPVTSWRTQRKYGLTACSQTYAGCLGLRDAASQQGKEITAVQKKVVEMQKMDPWPKRKEQDESELNVGILRLETEQ